MAQTVSVRVAIEELLLAWAASESAEWRNRIVERNRSGCENRAHAADCAF